jgi:alpha-glucosidase (family GH31 glycosyl hydrolase)
MHTASSLIRIDIDYMDGYKVFTLGQSFPLDKMRALISDLHSKDQHYIVMVDPGPLHDLPKS